MVNKSKLPKLKNRKDFEILSETGCRVHIHSWLLFNFKENQYQCLRCGWTIPKYVGTAVTRNRIRRWCREYFSEKRKNSWDPNIDLNVVLRRREKDFFKDLEYKEFKKILDKGVNKLEKQIGYGN